MKRFFQMSALLLASIIGVGCHAQVPAGPQSYTCPAANINGNLYTPLNPASNAANPPVPGLAYVDVNAGTNGGGVFCYIVQSWVSPNSSGPSNVFQIAVPAGDQTNLTWNAPVGVSTAGYTYIVSRANAVAVAPLTAPVLNTPSAVASLDKPALQVARKDAPPMNLIALLTIEKGER